MAKSSTLIPELNPFGNLGLAFSGGGFRAAAFSLGTLSYLNRLQIEDIPLTDNISYISSASGGSITNLLYTSGLHNGESFDDFYRTTIFKLTSDQILEKVLSVLNDDKEWNQPGCEKRRNLINSFAKVYDRSLFNGQTMDAFWNKKHIKNFEICLNATEFYRGLSFRFQTNGTADRYQVIGNNYLWFDVKKLDTLRKVKLADVLAASSCFPMGFEPIIFPEDYTYRDDESKSLNSMELREAVRYENYSEANFPLSYEPEPDEKDDPKQKKHIRSFGLMDGGITDNQSLKSLMLADKKRRNRIKPNPFDLMIITDVSSYFMDNYEVPEIAYTAGWRQHSINFYVQWLKKSLGKIGFIQVLSLILTISFITVGCWFSLFWFCIPLLVLGGIVLSIFIIISILKSIPAVKAIFPQAANFDIIKVMGSFRPIKRSFSEKIITKLADYLRFTQLNVFEQMLKSRISSVITMVSDVNLKQVRRLIYEIFYNDVCWENRRLPNFIYELSIHNQVSREHRFNSVKRLKWKATQKDRDLLLMGLEKISSVAEEARLAATTLWFDDQDVANELLKKIIASGQFTTCTNLLEYIISLERKKVKFDLPAQKRLNEIRLQLETDLHHFKNEPFFMYKLKKSS